MKNELYQSTLDDDYAWIEDDLNWRRWPMSRKLAMGFALVAMALLAVVALGVFVFLALLLTNMLMGTLQPDGTVMSPLAGLLEPLAMALGYTMIGVVGCTLASSICIAIWVTGED